jgi:hypothetical protein
LGIILYEICTKKLPFRGDDEIQFKSTPKLSKEFEDLNELFEEYFLLIPLINNLFLF